MHTNATMRIHTIYWRYGSHVAIYGTRAGAGTTIGMKMSAFGPQQTSTAALHMSAFGDKAYRQADSPS